SPDGKSIAFLATRRGLTDRETTMEDTHVWVMNADGSGRRDVGAAIDNRQGAAQWTPDGAGLMFTVQEHGSVGLYRVPIHCGAGEPPCKGERLVGGQGSVGAFSVSKDAIAYSSSEPSDLAQLYVRDAAGTARKVTDLNASVLGGRKLADV